MIIKQMNWMNSLPSLKLMHTYIHWIGDDNPVNISDAATLIFWYRIDLHKNILVLTRVYSFIYARVRSCCSVVWRSSVLEDEDEDCTTIISIPIASSASAALLYIYSLDMYKCMSLIVFISFVYNNIKCLF